MVPSSPSSGGPARNAHVADSRDDAHPGGGAPGSSAAALIPTGKPRRRRRPRARCRAASHGAAGDTTSRTPTAAGATTPQDRGPAEAVEQTGPSRRPAVIAVTNTAKPATPTQCRRVVAVDSARRASRWPTPSVSARASTMKPMTGSAARATPSPGSRRSPPRPASPAGTRHRDQRPTTRTADRDGDVHAPSARAARRPATPIPRRPPCRSEPGVEARHDRAPEVVLDPGALDVHRDVPDARPDPKGNRPRPPRTSTRARRRRGDDEQAARVEPRAPAHDAAEAPQRWISRPLDGSARTDPAAIASRSRPSAPLSRSRSERMSGIRRRASRSRGR